MKMGNYYNAMDKESGQGIKPTEAGFTTIISQDQLEQLKAKIRMGVSKVELGFVGSGKTMGQTISPETYGNDERRDLRELAKINNVELTTHTAPDAGPLSGFDGQRGFQENKRKDVLDEIKRAIDFAGDVAEGGAVVAHVGEFQRSIHSVEGTDKKRPFQGYTYFDDKGKKIKEEEEATVYLADNKTGDLINAVQKDQEIFIPEFEVEKDSAGNPIGVKEDKNGHFARIKDEKGEEDLPINKEPQKWDDVKKKYGFKNDNEVAIFLYRQQLQGKMNEIEGSIATQKYYKKYQSQGDPEMQNAHQKNIESLNQQKFQLLQQADRVETIEEVGVKRTARSLAELGMHARDKQIRIEKERGSKFERDLYVAPENITPETYGGHPQELKKLVQEGRKQMEFRLKDKGMSAEKAKKEAIDHIKATFDVGHANTWKRYFQGDDKDFKKWFMGQVKDLQENNIIGHVHVSDNFGYHDEHVVPGQGNVPIQEALKELKKDKKIDFVIEAGREGDQAWIRGLKTVSGTPLLGLNRPDTSDPWNMAHKSYFGRNAPPYFVVGQYAQSFGERPAKDFGAWSETSFE